MELVVIRYNKRELTFNINNYLDLNSKINLTNNFITGYENIYIGSNIEGDINLNRTFKMFSYSNKLVNDNIINNIYLNDQTISLRKYFDLEGRLIKESRYIGTSEYKKKYTYYDDNLNYTNLPTLIETDRDKTIYSYDELDNITHKVVTDKLDNILKMYYYEYDEFKRLIKESVYNKDNNLLNEIVYSYDNSGNILFKRNNLTNVKYEYHYNDIIKNRLDKVTSNGVTIKEYSYQTNSFNPSSINNDLLVYNGRQLMSYGNTSYKYNENGIRIEKITNNIKTKYTLSGNKVIKANDIIYRYDESNNLVGLLYNNNEHFYERDLLGNIIKIVDINNNSMVKYEYEAFGNPVITINESLSNDKLLIANKLKELNIYLYKGYIYDFETKLYYCESRYLDPEVGRWLTIDSFNYLDSNVANGVNLYAYCLNNPVMYIDPSGTMPKWLSSTLKIAAGGLLVSGLVTAGVLTGNPILIGAAVGSAAGFVGGGIVGGVSDIFDGGNFLDGFANGSLRGTIVGGLSGAFGASGFGVKSQALFNSLLSSGGYIFEQKLTGQVVTYGGLISSFLVGGISGYSGGDCYLHKSSGIWVEEVIIEVSKKMVIKEIGKEVVTNVLEKTIDFLVDQIDENWFGNKINKSIIH